MDCFRFGGLCLQSHQYGALLLKAINTDNYIFEHIVVVLLIVSGLGFWDISELDYELKRFLIVAFEKYAMS